MKIDPYKHKEKYLFWKKAIDGKIPNISKRNSELIWEYIIDMEHGLNVSNGSKKGARSYVRLNNLKQRMIFLARLFEKELDLLDITKIDERQLHEFSSKIRASLGSLNNIVWALAFSLASFLTGLGIVSLGLKNMLFISGTLSIISGLLYFFRLKNL